MPDILQVLSRYWKTMVLITVIATAIAAVLLLLQPKQYLSTATALPASNVLADKSRIFNENIQYLYSTLGNTDDLDRILGTAELDTLYKAVSIEQNLANHYKIKSNESPVLTAARKLKQNSSIVKSGYGELKIKVWDENSNKAAQLANALLKNIQTIHQHLQSRSNALTLENIKADYEVLKQQLQTSGDTIDNGGSTNIALLEARRNAQIQQLQQYEKLMSEYNLILRTNPPVLLVVENASPSLKADKPNVLQTLLLVLFASAVFSFLLVLFLESRKAVK